MGPNDHRRTVVRVVIYSLALMMVLVLLRYRRALIPEYGLRVTQVRETKQLGGMLAGEGQKLVLVEVRLVLRPGVSQPLRPALFALVDTDGQEYQPEPLSPLFSDVLVGGQGQPLEGTLVFRLPQERTGQNLSFHLEVNGDASDLESKDTGSEGGP
jgi:hypothetical protein